MIQRKNFISKASISLSLSPEIAKVREDLARVAVLTIVDGYVNESSVLEVTPTVLNCTLVGPITPLNECSFLVPLGSRDEVKTVYKLGSFKVATKDGPCTLNIAPWSANLGADGRASGEGQWTLIRNLPLHGSCWKIIVEVLKLVGELIVLSQASVPYKRFISALIRRRLGVKLPMEVECNLGMRRYQVLITTNKGEFPKFSKALGRYMWPTRENVIKSLLPVDGRFTHNIPSEAKGKSKMMGPVFPASKDRTSEIEHGSPDRDDLKVVEVPPTAVERRSLVGDPMLVSQTGDRSDNWRGTNGLRKARSPERGRHQGKAALTSHGSSRQRVEKWMERSPSLRILTHGSPGAVVMETLKVVEGSDPVDKVVAAAPFDPLIRTKGYDLEAGGDDPPISANLDVGGEDPLISAGGLGMDLGLQCAGLDQVDS